MKIVIAGGSGFIGRALTQSLLQAGHSVGVLSRNAQNARLPEGARAIAWDGRTLGKWAEEVADAQAIVNLTGKSVAARWNEKVKRELEESRLLPTQVLIQAMTQASAGSSKVLAQASAVGYYGDGGEEIMDENRPSGAGFLGELCARWEAAALEAEPLGVRVCRMRIGVVLDMGAGALPPLLMTTRLFVGGPYGSGKQWLPWIHREDLARAFQFVIEHEQANGAFNTAAPHPVRVNEFAHALGRALNRPSFFRAPEWALRVLFGEGAAILLQGQRALPTRLQSLGFRFHYEQVDDALRAILKG